MDLTMDHTKIQDWTLLPDPRSGSGLWIAVILGLVIVATMVIKFVFIHYLTFSAPPDRPINVHMLIEQIVFLLANNLYHLSSLLSLMTSIPIGSLFGSNGCNLFFVLGNPPHYIFMSSGMALYRFLMIKCASIVNNAIGRFKVLWILLALEMVLTVICAFLLREATWLRAFSVHDDFCFGHSEEMSRVLKSHSGRTDEELQRGDIYIVLVVAIILVAVVSEYSVYHKLMSGLEKHDRKMLTEGVISKTIFNNRRKTNVITLSGQVISFGVQIFSIIVGIILTFSDIHFSFPIRVLFRSGFCLAMSLCQLLTSPEIREHTKIKTFQLKNIFLSNEH